MFALAPLFASQAASASSRLPAPPSGGDVLAQASSYLLQLCFLAVAAVTAYHLLNKKY